MVFSSIPITEITRGLSRNRDTSNFHASNLFYDFSSLSILSFHALTFRAFRCCCFFIFFLSLQNALQLFCENAKFDYRENGLNFNGNTLCYVPIFRKCSESIYIYFVNISSAIIITIDQHTLKIFNFVVARQNLLSRSILFSFYARKFLIWLINYCNVCELF